jgi:hypothetical protein
MKLQNESAILSSVNQISCAPDALSAWRKKRASNREISFPEEPILGFLGGPFAPTPPRMKRDHPSLAIFAAVGDLGSESHERAVNRNAM